MIVGSFGTLFIKVKVMTEEVTTKKRSRRKRRSKAEIEAEKAAKLALAAEEAAKEAEGFEKVRARDEDGHFIKDDPSTPENEAWEWRQKEEPQIEEVKNDEVIAEMVEESVTSEEVAVEEPAPVVPEPVVSEPAPKATQALTYNGETDLSTITCRFKRRRAARRMG